MSVEIAFFPSSAVLRAWLAEHHGSAKELWVGFHKKNSEKQGITYADALDEALCFGWIDGVRKRIDEFSYTNRFTPRKRNSHWSLVNIRRAEELTKLGRMQPAGLEAFHRRDQAPADSYSYEASDPQLSDADETQFRANVGAWAFFQAQPPWYRRAANWWVMSAKKEETRRKRLAVLIDDSEHGRRLANLSRPSDQKPAAPPPA